MKHEIWWDEENSCVRMKLVGEFEPNDARWANDQITAMFEARSRRCLLIDHRLSPAPVGRESRAVLEEHVSKLEIEKMGFFGVTHLNRVVAKIVVAVSGQTQSTKFFKTEAEAIAWILGD